MNEDRELEEIYEVMPWPEDPWSEEGKSRYGEALERFKMLITQEWIRSLISNRDRISLIDICGGTGIGGIALAKTLSESGKHIDLTIADLRKSALKKAIKFGKEIGVDVNVEQLDVLRIHETGKKYDIVLLYGNSTPHFNPWKLVRLLASVSSSISEGGVFIIDEIDKIYMFLIRGYELVLPEVSKERVVISMHSDYDPITGEIKRLEFDLLKNSRAELPLYFWGLAEIMAITWLFFEDIDFIRDEDSKKGQCRGLIVANKPRRKITPNDLIRNPKILISYESR